MRDVDMVISHFAEDLSFLSDMPWQMFGTIYIYTKGEGVSFPNMPNVVLTKLPNVGRCDHT
jgi:hypothetical protein